MKQSTFLAAEVVSPLKEGLALGDVTLALRIQHHLFALRPGRVKTRCRAAPAAEKIRSQGCEDDPGKHEEYDKAEQHCKILLSRQCPTLKSGIDGSFYRL
jgi:hypothetical protein